MNSVSNNTSQYTEEDRLRRWRLVLGSDNADGLGIKLSASDLEIDRALHFLYERGNEEEKRRGGLGDSSPHVARWLGDIRKYFPSSVVQVMQQDAYERLGLRSMLMEPELLEGLEADVHLVATLISLKRIIPARTKETAREVVQKVVDQLMKRLEEPMRQAVQGALNRSVRNHRPRFADMDWHKTIQTNLRHYQAEYNTIIPERLIGFGRKQRRSHRDIILCVDQSGSMASSVVYSSIFGAVMASLPVVSTRMVLFDTAVVDLTDELQDPVDLLFGAQLGGGTDINRALAYCQSFVRRPQETILVLITDLYEGGNPIQLLGRMTALIRSGVNLITLLALSDAGAPSYSHDLAQKVAKLGIPCFACTPDKFPDLMAAAIKNTDLEVWLGEQGIDSVQAIADIS